MAGNIKKMGANEIRVWMTSNKCLFNIIFTHVSIYSSTAGTKKNTYFMNIFKTSLTPLYLHTDIDKPMDVFSFSQPNNQLQL